MNIGAALRKQAAILGQKTAVTVNDASVDFATLNRLTDRFALQLKDCGIEKGDTVAVMLPNSLEFVIAYFAVLRLGGVFMGLDPRQTQEELRAIFMDAHPKALVVDDRTKMKGLEEEFDVKVLPLAVGSAFLWPLNGHASLQLEDVETSEEDPAVLLYTSASTGKSKGVLLPRRSLDVFPEFCEALFGNHLSSHVFGVSIPMCHIGGPIYCNALAARGISLVIVEPFRPDRFLLAIQKHGVTGFHSVPPILMALLQAQLKMRLDLKSLFWIAPMGMSVPVSLMETLDRAFPGTRIFQGYGLTETAGGIVCVPPADAEFRKSSMGKIMVPGCIVETQGPEGEPLPAGEVGEIAVAGKCLMLGYFNRPELNAKVFRNGFFLTGDLGYQDEEGFFYHLGRKDDVINVGGEKVYPSEIEQALYFNPSVKEACVLGVDDPKKGKSIKAFVCPTPGQTLEKREIMNFLKDRLASYKIPQEFVFLDALPKTPVGKVAKDTLRKFVLGQTP